MSWNMHRFIFVNVKGHCTEKIGCPFKSPSVSCSQICTEKFKPDSFVCHFLAYFSASGNIEVVAASSFLLFAVLAL